MSDFKAEMHRIHFPLGLCPTAHWGANSAPRPPRYIHGAYSKGKEGKESGRPRAHKALSGPGLKVKDLNDCLPQCPRQTASRSHDQPLLLVSWGGQDLGAATLSPCLDRPVFCMNYDYFALHA